jgi:hypothetical protein
MSKTSANHALMRAERGLKNEKAYKNDNPGTAKIFFRTNAEI